MAELACVAIEQYCSMHERERLPNDNDAFKNYPNTHWIEDYGKRGFQLHYAYKLFRRRVSIAQEAFDKYLGDVEAGTKVLSIGCGPGPELAAAYEVLRWGRNVNVGFQGIDCESGWKKLFGAWTTRVTTRGDQFSWRTKKVADEKTLVKLLKVEKASVVIFSYFLNDFGNGLNPRRLMERVPTLQQVVIFDNRSILLRIHDMPSKNEEIYRHEYLAERTRGASWVENVQVLAYSRAEMNTDLGFAIMLRHHSSSYELFLKAGHFKAVERSIARQRSYRLLVGFTAIKVGKNFRNDGFTAIKDEKNFRSDFVNLVASRLAKVLKKKARARTVDKTGHEARVRTVVTNWCKDIPELGDEGDRDDFYVEGHELLDLGFRF